MLLRNIKSSNYSIAQILHSDMAHGVAIKDNITERSHPLSFSMLKLIRAENKKTKNLWNKIIAKYHYLGYTGTVGRYIRYFICDCSNFESFSNNNAELSDHFHEFINNYTYKEIDELLGVQQNDASEDYNIDDLPKSHLGVYLRFGWRFKRIEEQKNPEVEGLFFPIIGCISAGSATYWCSPRDYVLGLNQLTKNERTKYLKYISNNWRFLILGKWHNLASHILSKYSKIVQKDWLTMYNNPLIAIESFVMRGRFEGSSYIANRWIKIGKTKGYSKAGSISKNSVSVYRHGEKKDIYLKLNYRFAAHNDSFLYKIKKRNRFIIQELGRGKNLVDIIDSISQNCI